MKKLFVFLFLIITTLSFVACAQSSTDNGSLDNNANKVQLTVNQAVIYLKPYETFDLIAKYSGDSQITYSTDTPSVATVDNGKITAVAVGDAIITVTAGNDSKNCYVHVLPDYEVPTVMINNAPENTVEINLSDEYTLGVTVKFAGENVDADLKFASSDESVFTIDDNGKITATGVGEAYVFVSGEWRNFDKEDINCLVKVIVKGNVLFNLSLDKNEIYAVENLDGENFNNVINITPNLVIAGNVITDGFVFNSSNEDIITVTQDGVVTALSTGTAEVVCNYTDGAETYFASSEINVSTIVRDKQMEERFVLEFSKAPNFSVLDQLFNGNRETIKVYDVTGNRVEILSDSERIVTDGVNRGERVWEIHNSAYAYRVNMLVVDYVIETAKEIKEIFPSIEESAYVILANNVSNVGDYAGVGKFAGTLDGQGYTISDINVKDRGLFGLLTGGATIKNLAVSNVTLSGTSGVFGVQADSANIENVSVWITGISTTETVPCGGLVFQIYGGMLNVKNSLVYANGVAEENFGAVVGSWYKGAYNLENSYFITDGTPCAKVFKTGDVENLNEKGTTENLKGSWDYVYSSAESFKEELTETDSKISLEGFNPDIWEISDGQIPCFKTDIGFKSIHLDKVQGDRKGGETFYFSKNASLTDYSIKYVKNGYYQVQLPDGISGNVVSAVSLGSKEIKDFLFDKQTKVLSVATAELSDLPVGISSLIVKTENGGFSLTVTVADFVITSASEFNTVMMNKANGKAYVVLDCNINNVTGYSHTFADADAFTGTFDGKGNVIDGIEITGHAFMSMLGSGGVIKNLSIINAVQTNTATALLLNQNRGLIDNVFVSGTTMGAGGLINANYASGRLNNVIVSVTGLNVDTLNNGVIKTNYLPEVNADKQIVNSYAVTNYKGGFVNADTTFATQNEFITAFNGTLPVGFENSYFELKQGRKLFYNGKNVMRITTDLLGEKNLGELFYFAKNFENANGYKGAYVSNDCYNLTLPIDVGTVNSVSISEKPVLGFGYANKVLSIPVSAIVDVANGNSTIIIDTATATYKSNVTVADYVASTYADLLYMFRNVFTGYMVLDNDIEWDTSVNYSRTQNVALTGTFDGKGYAVKDFTINASGIYYQIQGGTIKNVAFLNVKNISSYGLFANETANMKFDNVAVTYKASGAGGLVGMMSGTTEVLIKDTIIVYNEIATSATAGVIACTYKSTTKMTLTNSYFVSDGKPFKTQNTYDTSGIYTKLQANISKDIDGLKTASNSLKDFNLNYWTIDASGNICFGGEIVVNEK